MNMKRMFRSLCFRFEGGENDLRFSHKLILSTPALILIVLAVLVAGGTPRAIAQEAPLRIDQLIFKGTHGACAR
jgi:hypothetical protein